MYAKLAKSYKTIGLHCITSPNIDDKDIFNKMKYVGVDMNQNERREYVALKLCCFGPAKDHQISVDGKMMCRMCWCKYHNVSTKLRTSIETKIAKGITNFERAGKGIKTKRRKSAVEMCFRWLQNYAKTRGDHMPDYDEVHLPDYRWRDVWKKYRTEFNQQPDICDPVSEMVFTRLRSELSYIKIRKVKRFAACTICTELRETIGKTSGATKAMAKKELNDHIDWQFRERDKYYKHRFDFCCTPTEPVVF